MVKEEYSYYSKLQINNIVIDPYRLIYLLGIKHPALQHAVKKILRLYDKNSHKSSEKDIKEILDSMLRYRVMIYEDSKYSSFLSKLMKGKYSLFNRIIRFILRNTILYNSSFNMRKRQLISAYVDKMSLSEAPESTLIPHHAIKDFLVNIIENISLLSGFDSLGDAKKMESIICDLTLLQQETKRASEQ